MSKFVVYEVWTRSRVLEAENFIDAYELGSPEPDSPEPMSLSNWHIVPLDEAEQARHLAYFDKKDQIEA